MGPSILMGYLLALRLNPISRGDYPLMRPPLHFRSRYSVPTFCGGVLSPAEVVLNHLRAAVYIGATTQTVMGVTTHFPLPAPLALRYNGRACVIALSQPELRSI